MLEAQHARRVLLEKFNVRFQTFAFAVPPFKYEVFKKIHTDPQEIENDKDEE